MRIISLWQRPRVAVLAAALTLAGAALGACSSTPAATATREPGVVRLDNFPSGDKSADQAALDSLKRAARLLAKQDGCADGRCASVGLGAKPCGGPWEYLVYCPTSTDVTRLRAVATEVERAERVFNERYGIMSDCAVTPEPGGACGVKPPS